LPSKGAEKESLNRGENLGNVKMRKRTGGESKGEAVKKGHTIHKKGNWEQGRVKEISGEGKWKSKKGGTVWGLGGKYQWFLLLEKAKGTRRKRKKINRKKRGGQRKQSVRMELSKKKQGKKRQRL